MQVDLSGGTGSEYSAFALSSRVLTDGPMQSLQCLLGLSKPMVAMAFNMISENGSYRIYLSSMSCSTSNHVVLSKTKIPLEMEGTPCYKLLTLLTWRTLSTWFALLTWG